MRRILILTFLLVSSICWSQRSVLKLFSLEEKMILHTVEEQYSDESLIYIKDYRAVNISEAFSQFREIRTYHKIIKVQDDIGVEQANKITIYLDKNDELLSFKLRTISSKGVVKEYDDSKLEEIKTGKGDRKVKVAATGLEVGGEVEMLYSVSLPIKINSRVYYNSKYPIQDLKFELFNSGLGYIVKTYNELPRPILTERSLICEAKNVNPLSKEGLSNFRSKINRIDYKINNVGSEDKYVSWESISKNIVNVFKYMNGKGLVKKYLNKLNLEGKTQEDQVYLIQKKIKKTIVLEDNDDDSYSDIKSILTTGLANETGVIKLYASCFRSMNIPVDFVLACSRFDGWIDESFPQRMDLNHVLLFFPDLNKYMSIESKLARLGLPPSPFGNSRALVIKTKVAGIVAVYEYTSHSFVTLPMIKAHYNTGQIKIKAQLNENFDKLIIDYESKSKGYRAFEDRYSINNVSDYSELIEDISDLEIDTIQFTNLDSKYSMDPKVPFIIKAEVRASSLVQDLESDILVELGLLLGRRSPFNTEKNRSNDVILNYPKLSEYKIDFVIPKGYSCSNLETLSKYLFFTLEDKTTIYYNVTYEVVDGILKIKVKEGYNAYLVKKENYADYCAIGNAAVNFSNFTLVLEKQ